MPVQETVSKFNLVTGEDTYAGQNAQNPETARRLLSLIPTVAGELTREAGQPLFLPTNLGSKVGELYEYDYNDASGNRQIKYFAATSTALYMSNGASWQLQTLPIPFSLSSSATPTAPFTDYPTFVNINNLMHFSDGVFNWIYDGPNGAFVVDGFNLPLWAPAIDPTPAGTFSTLIGAFYWFTFADETGGRVHESDSSPISASTGIITSKSVVVRPTPGTVNTTLGSTTVTGTGTIFQANILTGINLVINDLVHGMNLWVNGVSFGVISGASSPSSLILVNPAPATVTDGNIIIAPVRAANIHIYRSEEDGSRLGQFLTSLSVGTASGTFTDQSPFTNQPGTTILNINRPIRNDPAPSSKVMEVHKYRLWRRRENIPNRFNYTANEEVLSGTNGSPQESVPGTDIHTLSDIINETAYPRTSSAIRALKSHGDALFIGTETEIIPLWGDTIGQFALSQVTAVDGGVISRWGMQSLSHGLSIFSYDRKLYLYPPISPIYAVVPQDLNVTDQLIEIGRPMRKKFLSLLSSDIQNVRTLKYRYNSRDWLVVSYQDKSNVYHTFVYDFETKGWVELQRGFVSLAVFEITPGVKVLVGGGSDGLVYVADDLTGAFAPNTTFPAALYRTALIDFGTPDSLHEPNYLELEVSNPALLDTTTTINFYLDPPDADNPGTANTLFLNAIDGEPNRYRGFFAPSVDGGVVCRRLMIEFSLASDTNAGVFRGIVLKSEPIPDLVK